MLQHCQVLDRPRRFADHTKHDFDPMPLPTKCLGWAVEQLLDVRLCVAIAPSPGKRTSHRARLRASTLPQGAQGEDAIVCCHMLPHLRARMGPASTQSQSNAWVGLSSRCSMCYCVLPLLPHLRVRMNTRVSPRVGARVVSLIHFKHDCHTKPPPVECLVWAIEL